jgi:hypothetical protein
LEMLRVATMAAHLPVILFHYASLRRQTAFTAEQIPFTKNSRLLPARRTCYSVASGLNA